jgi:uncharacterized membrane protein YfcA
LIIWPILAGLVAGFVLGFLGAGGTVVALPVLLYLAKVRPHLALGTNALGVSIIALALLAWRVREKSVQFRDGIIFSIPGLVGIYLGARLGLVYPGARLVYLLGILLFVVAGWIFYLSTQVAKLKPNTKSGSRQPSHGANQQSRIFRVAATAFAIGCAAGFFAIGGGFMIVPGLMLAGGLELGPAARTALLPIAVFAGLVGSEYLLSGSVRTDWAAWMVVAGLGGGGAGIWLSNRLSMKIMQRAFGVFLLLIGCYMIFR